MNTLRPGRRGGKRIKEISPNGLIRHLQGLVLVKYVIEQG